MKNTLTQYAKTLRRKCTDAERILWKSLRSKQMEGVKFRRQQPIEGYIVDFVSFEKRLIIELDGGQHAVNRDQDVVRDRCLTRNGFEVLRFWNNEVMQNQEGVLEKIRRECLV